MTLVMPTWPRAATARSKTPFGTRGALARARRHVVDDLLACVGERGRQAGEPGLENALAHGEADADARIDRPNAAGEPRPRTIVEEQVLRHDTEIEP